MSLISAAQDARARFQSVDAQAVKQIKKILAQNSPDVSTVMPVLTEYVHIKYMLKPTDMKEHGLEALGKRSLERVQQIGNLAVGMDVSPHCGSASSATHKKILLVLALQQDLGIHIPPFESAECETLEQLADCICRQLMQKRG